MSSVEAARIEQIDCFIAAMDSARSIDDIFLATKSQIQALGFDYFGYQLLAPPIGPAVRLYLTNKPNGWTCRYIEQKYVSDDLVTRHAARTLRPFLWRDISQERLITPTQRLMFTEATEFGLKAGGTVPIHGPAAAKALFSIAANMSQHEFDRLFLQERHALQIIATYVHEHILRLGLDTPPPPPTIKLTPRELEVLTWTARGKTAWEISEIIAISEATVREYLENASHKLGTYNKSHAVAVAILHALIIP